LAHWVEPEAPADHRRQTRAGSLEQSAFPRVVVPSKFVP
jgi:hypothetical protein